ncbi:hypothetical protein SAMN00120144_4253 [Hymenobacter roseosalivarius DSM 11622]|uniref:Uncharacterized protein n=1 Tax=Hymenobacter roseosalivarius DSM 11622 TaxID=645990 RepID=A0A1W1UQC3_9BACT|nr:hypothetical protein [Hymenobacter roseosalivarius]SMB83297.1 hypothetical protein SAMN00120144_4253 [Hymenobacter roseosalivarius DSM 11622]
MAKSNQQSQENKGNPAGDGQTKSDPTSTPLNSGELEQRLADEYTDDGLDEVPPHLTNNPNRNLDKTDLDNTPYT